MVRSKTQPKQLDEGGRKERQWDMNDMQNNSNSVGTSASTSGRVEPTKENNTALTIEDLINDESESEDEDYVPASLPLNYSNTSTEVVPVYNVDSEESNQSIDNDSDVEAVCEIQQVDAFEVYDVKSDEDDDDDVIFQDLKVIAQRKKKGEIEDYGDFESILSTSQFSVKIDCTPLINQIHCLLGEIEFYIFKDLDQETELFRCCDSYWMYVNNRIDKSAIYFEWFDSQLENTNSPVKGKSKKCKQKNKPNKFKYFMINGLLDKDLWDELNILKTFQIVHSNYDPNDKKITLQIYLLKSGLVNLKFPADSPTMKKPVTTIISYFFGVSPPKYGGQLRLKHDIGILFEAIKSFHRQQFYSSKDVQHPSLIPQLRPYQAAAVRWMLHKENFDVNPSKTQELKQLHSLYVELKSVDDVLIYYNKYGSFIVKDKPFQNPTCPGGILADEMGLGKTVEVLSCMLCHPRKDVPEQFYQEPIIIEQSFKKRRKKRKSAVNDIFTLKNENEDGEDDKEELKNLNDETSSQPERKSTRKGLKVHFGLSPEKESAEFNLDVEDTIKNESTETTNKRGLPKRRAAAVADLSSFICDSDQDDDYKPVKKVKMTPVKKNTFDVEKEISDSTYLSAIESVIINVCHEGSVKDYKKIGSHKEFRKFLRQRRKDPFYMMSLRERLQMEVNKTLAQYSGAAIMEHSRKVNKGFFDLKVEQKSYFECLCGEALAEISDEKYRVQCTECSLWQHAECVAYDVSDPYRGVYRCPHCWTQENPIVSGATLIVAPSSISYQVSCYVF